MPLGRRACSGRKQPSFIGIVGSTKHRIAYTTPDRVCENDELMVPRAWGDVPSKSTSMPPSRAVTATFTSNVRSGSTPSPSISNVPWYVPAGRRRRSSRTRRSESSIESRTKRSTVVVPKRSRSSSTRRAMTFTPATSARTSPITLSGARLLRAMMPNTSSTGASFRYRWTGGSNRPSANVSVASAASPATALPPRSATWMRVPAKKTTRPSPKTGRNTRMSLAWMPPRYGSFSAKTSPCCIESSGLSSSNDGNELRRLAPCMRLVAVDCATSWPAASRIAAHASAPSWMKVLCEDRTTTTLASSAATSRPLRMISPVMASSTAVAFGMRLTCFCVLAPRPPNQPSACLVASA